MWALLIQHLSEKREETSLYERYLLAFICLQPSHEVQHGKGAGEGIHSPQGGSCAQRQNKGLLLPCSLYPESDRLYMCHCKC